MLAGEDSVVAIATHRENIDFLTFAIKCFAPTPHVVMCLVKSSERHGRSLERLCLYNKRSRLRLLVCLLHVNLDESGLRQLIHSEFL